MKVLLNDQDVRDSVHVATAVERAGIDIPYFDHQWNTLRDYEEHVLANSRPQDVVVEIGHNTAVGFYGNAKLAGRNKPYNEQGLKNAIGVYLAKYYSFDATRLQITLGYDISSRLFDATVEIV